MKWAHNPYTINSYFGDNAAKAALFVTKRFEKNVNEEKWRQFNDIVPLGVLGLHVLNWLIYQ